MPGKGAMRDELQQIDISAIADLVRIKREEETLRERLEKMTSARQKVSAVVYARVRSDYESRQSALDAESRPLKERARREYGKLKAVRGQVEQLVEEATLEKEELEFRNELGEFADGNFQARLAECEKRVAERRSELDEIEMLRAQFVAAFHSEHELEGPPAEADDAADATVRASGEPEEPAVPSATVPLATASGGNDATVVVAPRTPASGSATSGESGVTVAVSLPRVVVMVENKPGEEYVLKPGVTTIGRSPRSQIRLPQGEVSRHHADIVMGTEGYRVMDAGSDNGIFVNGQRVTEHLLTDGDVLQIGTQRLVFKV
jgi:hypothetical protein